MKIKNIDNYMGRLAQFSSLIFFVYNAQALGCDEIRLVDVIPPDGVAPFYHGYIEFTVSGTGCGVIHNVEVDADNGSSSPSVPYAEFYEIDLFAPANIWTYYGQWGNFYVQHCMDVNFNEDYFNVITGDLTPIPSFERVCFVPGFYP